MVQEQEKPCHPDRQTTRQKIKSFSEITPLITVIRCHTFKTSPMGFTVSEHACL